MISPFHDGDIRPGDLVDRTVRIRASVLKHVSQLLSICGVEIGNAGSR